MKHPTITGLTGTTLPQTPLNGRGLVSHSARGTRTSQPFEQTAPTSTVQPQIPQAVQSLNSQTDLGSLESNTVLNRFDKQNSALNSGMTQLMDSLTGSGLSGEPAVPSPKSQNPQAASLAPTADQNLATSAPGSLINVLA